jgi:hypothetical protein
MLDPRALAEMADVYALDGLRLGNGPGGGPVGALRLTAADGARIGWLAWDQGRPGRATLFRLLPAVLVLALAVAAGAAVVGRGVSDLVRQMLKDRKAAEDALVRARVALQAAQAARGHADRLEREMVERATVEACFAELRQETTRDAAET